MGLDAGSSDGLEELSRLADGPVALVVGAEGRGIGALVSKTCDVVVSIPMTAATESLNASVAAGIALHWVAHRRGQRPDGARD